MIEQKLRFSRSPKSIATKTWFFVSISTFGQEMMDSTIETYDFLENEIASLKIKYFIYKFDSR